MSASLVDLLYPQFCLFCAAGFLSLKFVNFRLEFSFEAPGIWNIGLFSANSDFKKLFEQENIAFDLKLNQSATCLDFYGLFLLITSHVEWRLLLK